MIKSSKKDAPNAPKKAPRKEISPSSEFYTENHENNDLSPENLKARHVKLKKLVRAVKKHPGNGPFHFYHKNLNYDAGVPKMKLPPHLQGGGRTKKRSRKSKKTRKQKRSS